MKGLLLGLTLGAVVAGAAGAASERETAGRLEAALERLERAGAQREDYRATTLALRQSLRRALADNDELAATVVALRAELATVQTPWLYVHNLIGRAVDVTGLSPAFLTVAVPLSSCESTNREGARNGTHWGLLQIDILIHAARIRRLGFTPAAMLEAAANLRVGEDIYEEQGVGPWSCTP